MKMKKTLISILIMTLVMSFSFTMPGLAFADDQQDTVRFGTVEEYSTFESGSILEDAFYYDDNWFTKPGTERNDALALVSMQLVASAVENDKDERCADFLKKLGFENIKSVSLDKENDAFGYTLGMKKVGDDTLAAMVMHSFSFDGLSKEIAWVQNFTINGKDQTSGEQYAYMKAMEKFDTAAVKKEIENFSASGDIKFWIMGQSRGGALANLAAKKASGEVTSSENIYAYTFESPATAEKDQVSKAKCGFIHNYLTSDDIVTMVPPWGMSRYGNTYELKAEIENKNLSKSDINEILKRLGSKAELSEESILDTIDPKDIINKLEATIGSRADYSKAREDKFKAIDSGKKVTISYDYQTVFQNLMRMLFGGKGIDTTGIADKLQDVVACLEPLLRGYMIEQGEIEATRTDPNAYYWDTTVKLCELLDSLDSKEGNLPITKEDVYVLLKLAAPIAINKEMKNTEGFEITDEPIDTGVIMGYFINVITIAGDAKGLTISHNFDVLLARLKALTSYPDAGDIAIEITVPKAGDPATNINKALASASDELGITWLSASGAWDSEDKTLRKNKVYYLKAEFEVIGHNVPEKMNVTINGEKPLETPKVTYRDGVSIIKGVWKFTLGEPKECTLSFVSYGENEAPGPMKAPFGEVLKYVEKPVMADEGNNAFRGWEYDYSKSWEECTVSGDMEFVADWVTMISKIDIDFDIPQVGQEVWASPTTESEDIIIGNVELMDENYTDVRGAIPSGRLTLGFNVYPEYEMEFVTVDDGWGGRDYGGTLKVNGKKADYSYDDGSNYIRVTYKFKVKAAPTMGKDGTAIGKGASASIANDFLTNWLSDKDPKGSKVSPLKLRSGKQTKTSITLNWTKPGKAKKFVIYGNLSGSENKLKKIKTVAGKKSFTVKKIGKTLKKGKYYKFMVVALDKNKKVVSTSRMIHVATKGSSRAGNFKALKARIKKSGGSYKAMSKISLKKGKTAQIKASAVKASKKASVKTILKTRYESSNVKVAKVTAGGKITAAGKGTCTVYVYTQNGVSKAIKVTVK